MRKFALLFGLLLAVPLLGWTQGGLSPSLSASGTITLQTASCSGPGANHVKLRFPSNAASIGVTLAGTWSGTVQFVASVDDVNWAAIAVTPTAGGAAVTSSTANGTWSLGASGMAYLCIYASSYASGAVAVSMSVTTGAQAAGGDTITSPKSTLAVGGSPSVSTLDLHGAAGQIMAGDTPALTAQPTLGTASIGGQITLLDGTNTAANTSVVSTRSGVGLPVPYFVALPSSSPIAFDIAPTPGATDFTSTTGVAWTDLCTGGFANPCVAAGNADYQVARLGIMANGFVHLESAFGGAGARKSLILQGFGGTVGIGTGVTTAPPFSLVVNNSISPALDIQLSNADEVYLGCASASGQWFIPSSTGDCGVRGKGGNLYLGSNSATPNPSITIAAGSPGTVMIPILAAVNIAAARKGTFICTSGGSIVVANANYLVTSDVVITMKIPGGTVTYAPNINAQSTGVSFTAGCATGDTSTYNYDILN